jgi:hypothetical protein
MWLTRIFRLCDGKIRDYLDMLLPPWPVSVVGDVAVLSSNADQ